MKVKTPDPVPAPPSAADEQRRLLAEEAAEELNKKGRRSTILTKGVNLGIRPAAGNTAPKRKTILTG